MPNVQPYAPANSVIDVSFFEEALLAVDCALWSWGLDDDEFVISKSFFERTGITERALSSFNDFLTLFSAADRQLLLEAVHKGAKKSRPFSCSLHLTAQDRRLCLHVKGRSISCSPEHKKLVGSVQVSEVFSGDKKYLHISENLARQLQRSEVIERDFYQSIISHADTAIAIKDPQGKFLLVSPAFANRFCTDKKNIESKTVYDLFDEGLARRFAKLDHMVWAQQRTNGGELQPQFSMVFEFSRNTYCSVHYPIADESGNVFAVGQIVTDVSRRQFVYEQVEKYRSEMSLLLDSVRAPIWYLDRTGKIKHCNQTAKTICGAGNVLGQPFLQVMPVWESAAQIQKDFDRVIATATPLYDTKVLISIDGVSRRFKVDNIPTLEADGQVNGVLLVMNDVTAETERKKALEDSEARYRALIESTQDLVWCFELNPSVDINLPIEAQINAIREHAKLVDCNNHFAEMCGAPSVQQLLYSPLDLIKGIQHAEISQAFIRAGYRLDSYDSEQILANGKKLIWQLTIMGTIDNGRLVRIWGSSKNITEQKRHLAVLEYQATHDSLTQLANRTALYSEIENAIAGNNGNTSQSRRQMALLLVDLDRFKEINDTLGHQVGDMLLKKIGPRLQDEIEGVKATVARLGGDEFAIFMPSIRNPQQAVVFGHRVLDSISQAFYLEGFHTEISASVGIALYPSQAKDLNALMRYADVAMYKAKKETKGVALYSPDEDPHSPERLEMMVDLRRSIRENQLLLHYQPKIDFASGALHGFEALLRWNHPKLGFVPPNEFIPVAENTGLIHPMTSWVLENAMRQLCEWNAQGFTTKVSVNLSARNLLDDSIVKDLYELLARHQLPPQQLELEITESAIMADPKRALKALNQIHDLGVDLSIDDFGTGYSSLSYLKQLPVQLLKIDYSFVINMLQDEQDRIIVNSTINLAHNLGLKVVAEGVECAEIAAALQSIGCDYAQGYFYSRPVAAEDARVFAKNYSNKH